MVSAPSAVRPFTRAMLALLVAMGGMVAIHGMLLVNQLTLDPGYRSTPLNPLAVNGLFTGGAGVLGLVLAALALPRRDAVALAAGAAVPVAVVFGALLSGGYGPLSPGHGDVALAWFGGTLLWLPFLLPPFVMAVAGVPRAVPLAMAVAVLAFLAAAGPALGPELPPAMEDRVDAQPWRIALAGVAHAAFGLATIAGTLALWRAPRWAAPAPASPSARSPGLPPDVAPWWTAAGVFLVLTWVVPGWGGMLWMAPVLLAAGPAFGRASERPLPALAAAVVFLVGLFPWWPATRTDTFGDGSSYPGAASLLEAAVRGPRWWNPGIDSLLYTDVGLPGFALGLVLLAALLLLAADKLPVVHRSASTR